MKTLKIMAIMALLASTLVAKEIVLVVECRDGVAQIGPLVEKLNQGWKVVTATPVQDSNSIAMIGRAKQSYTASIVYVLEKE